MDVVLILFKWQNKDIPKFRDFSFILHCSYSQDWEDVKWTSLFLRLSLFLLCYMFNISTLAFLQSSDTSPVLQDLSKMVERGSAMTSASSLSTRGHIPLGPMDLWVSSLLKWSLTRSSSTKGRSSILQAFSLTPRSWDSRGQPEQ